MAHLMALNVPKLFPVLFILFVVITIGTSIKCWTCRSDADPKCADPFDNSSLPITDCDTYRLDHLTVPDPNQPNRRPKYLQATMCRKTRQKVNGNWRTIRGCAWLGSPGHGTGNEHHCLIQQGSYDIYVEFCNCNSKDGCNSGPNLVQSKYVVALLAGISLLWAPFF